MKFIIPAAITLTSAPALAVRDVTPINILKVECTTYFSMDGNPGAMTVTDVREFDMNKISEGKSFSWNLENHNESSNSTRDDGYRVVIVQALTDEDVYASFSVSNGRNSATSDFLTQSGVPRIVLQSEPKNGIVRDGVRYTYSSTNCFGSR